MKKYRVTYYVEKAKQNNIIFELDSYVNIILSAENLDNAKLKAHELEKHSWSICNNIGILSSVVSVEELHK